jgi:hypothetical protein
MQQTATKGTEMCVGRNTLCGTRLQDLGLVEVGLETGFKDVEGSGQGRCCHASYSTHAKILERFDFNWSKEKEE